MCAHDSAVFDAHDLRLLISEAKTHDKADLDTAFLLAFRRRNDTPMKDLLRRLGADPSRADAWERGFLHLAFLHHGVGLAGSRPAAYCLGAAATTLTIAPSKQQRQALRCCFGRDRHPPLRSGGNALGVMKQVIRVISLLDGG
jgi:hypothetical protein